MLYKNKENQFQSVLTLHSWVPQRMGVGMGWEPPRGGVGDGGG